MGALAARGFRVVGPTVRDGAIVYDDLDSAADLPIGWTDVQEAGRYRLERRDDEARFGYAVGPHSWKQFLLPAARPALARAAQRRRRSRSRRSRSRTRRSRSSACAPASCTGSRSRTASFSAAGTPTATTRPGAKDAFVVAVNCFEPGGTCFCVSMGTGPKADAGYDLALTEILDGDAPLPRRGRERARRGGARTTCRGGPRCRTTSTRPAPRSRARPSAMGRHARHDGHPRPARAKPRASRAGTTSPTRCLTCGNCTLVCPTCFCTSVEDVTDLAGEQAERVRVWDSCFSVDHSYIHGGSVRPSGRSRYRQWLTHKFGTWHDQFGSSGCVGCGRCITWCPVGIDVTEELTAIRATRGEPTMETIETVLQRRAALPGADAGRARAGRRLRLERPLPRRASCSSATATTADTFYVLRHGSVALETFVPARGAGHDRDARGRRGRRLVVALPAVPLALRRACALARARDELRRRLPARQVRGRPAARLRPDVPLRAGGDRAAAVDAAATPGRLWLRRRRLTPSTRPGRWRPCRSASRGGGARRATRGRSSSSRVAGERARAGARAVHDALRVRDRRGADLGLRRRRAAPLVHTVRAVGAVTRGDLRVASPARCSACAGRSGTRGRSRPPRAATSSSSPAASGSRRCGRRVYDVLRAARRVRRGRAPLRQPDARRPALSGASSSGWRGRFDLQVDVTVDARRGRLARQGRRRAEAHRRRAASTRRRRSRSSAGRRS